MTHELTSRGFSSGSRIELDQENPAAGDIVTFTVQAKGATDIDLVCGDAQEVNHWPPGTASSIRLPVGSSFELPTNPNDDDGYTAVAWLIKKGDAVAGTLFWVNS